MAEYRIRKGEHEYVAQKVETLQELLGRGLISPLDEVSVDGAPFVLVGELPGFGDQATPADDLWRHWNDAREASAESGVLSDFLEEIAPRPQSVSRAALTPVPTPPPEHGAPVLDLPDVAVDSLSASEPAAAPPVPPLIQPSEPVAGPSPRQELRLVEPDHAPAPVSFADWVDRKGGGTGESVLKDFGRVDDGIVLHGRERRGANWWRTGGLLLAATLGVLLWHTWVRTIAQTAYPTEADLIAAQQGDGPSLPGLEAVTAGAQPRPELSARDAERRLRSRVAGDIRQFGSGSELEDAIFQELSNLQASPVRVQVETLREVGSGDYQRDRPTDANVTIQLAGIDEDVFELIRERLTLTWLVVAKYGNQGKVKFQTVTVRFGAPSASTYVHPGHRVLELGTRRASVTDLLLDSQ